MVNWSTMWTAEKSLEPRDQSLKPLNECCSLRIFSVGIPSHLAQRQQNDERKSTKRCRWVLYYAMTCVSSNILRSINIIDWNYDTSQVFPTLKHPCSIWTHRINASNEYFISIDKLKNKTLNDFDECLHHRKCIFCFDSSTRSRNEPHLHIRKVSRVHENIFHCCHVYSSSPSTQRFHMAPYMH